MHIAACHHRTPESKFTKFGEEKSIGWTLIMQNFVVIQQEVSEISAIKNLFPKIWAKIHQNRLRPATPKAPIMPNFIEISETILEKNVTKIFTPFNILTPQRDPMGQSSPFWVMGYINYLQNFVPFWRPLSEISAAKLCQFCIMTHKKHYDMSPHYMQQQ